MFVQLLAEVSHFHQQRIRDYNRAIKIFLTEQIAYYQKVIVSRLAVTGVRLTVDRFVSDCC